MACLAGVSLGREPFNYFQKKFSRIIHMQLAETKLAHCASPTLNPIHVSKVTKQARGTERGIPGACVSGHCLEGGLDGDAQVWPCLWSGEKNKIETRKKWCSFLLSSPFSSFYCSATRSFPSTPPSLPHPPPSLPPTLSLSQQIHCPLTSYQELYQAMEI